MGSRPRMADANGFTDASSGGLRWLGGEDDVGWHGVRRAVRARLYGGAERASLEVRVGEAIVKEKQGETLRGKLKTGVVRKSGSV